VTKEVAKQVPRNRLMNESEWRGLGITQSPGWVSPFSTFSIFPAYSSIQIHYMIHSPERHVIMFRRPKEKLSSTAATKPIRQKQKIAS